MERERYDLHRGVHVQSSTNIDWPVVHIESRQTSKIVMFDWILIGASE